MKGSRSTSRPWYCVTRSATLRVQGMCASMPARSPGVNSAALRSSLSTARLAFLCSTLQRNGLTMQTARSRTARTTG